MNTRMLGVLAVSALLGGALATTSVAQERQRGFDAMNGAGAGQMRGRMRMARGPGAALQPARFIARHDADEDGRVSAAEFIDVRLQAADRLIERRDADGDGLISAEEQDAPRGQPGRGARGETRTRPERPARSERAEPDREALAACVRETSPDFQPRADGTGESAFAASDGNGDGKLSLEEISAAIEGRAQQQFARLDADADGYVVEDELVAQAQAQRELRRTLMACAREQRQG